MSKTLTYASSIGKIYLCICGTSVPSERLFSKSGFIIDAFHSRLMLEKVNMFTFLAKNLSSLAILLTIMQFTNYQASICIVFVKLVQYVIVHWIAKYLQ